MAGYEVTIISEGQAIGAGIEPALFVGDRGPQGKPGEAGPEGPRGATGPEGPEGARGEAGPQGNKGEKGDPGTSFKLLGRYETLAALEAAHPAGEAGDAYAVGFPDSNRVYLWDGDANVWADVGPLQGPEGPQGIRGIQGAQGEKGESGEPGPRGEAGAEGVSGANGAQGSPGKPGAQGPKGDTGLQGDPGPQGAPGADGQDGAVGPNRISANTATPLTGILKGDGSTVGVAVAGTDYAAHDHTHADALTHAGGTLTGALNAGGAQSLTVAQVRNIYAGTADMTPGATALPTGTLYLMYE